MTMEPKQPQMLPLGKCEQCRGPLESDRFALWYDHKGKKRSCHHLVCGMCRGMMCGWKNMNCPNANCGKRFYAVQDAISPGTASLQDFFKFVNHSESGRITREELVDWYTTNFNLTHETALNIIFSNWQYWDRPKNHSFWKLGWIRPQDQGDLDMDEFPAVQRFMATSLAKSLAEKHGLPPSVCFADATAPDVDSAQPRGQKRNFSSANTFLPNVVRNVAQRQISQSEGLQSKLCCNVNKGRAWFDQFDIDMDGGLGKGELISALLQTFEGSHHLPREQITSMVNDIFDTLDADGSGLVDFQEFQILREAMMTELNRAEPV